VPEREKLKKYRRHNFSGCGLQKNPFTPVMQQKQYSIDLRMAQNKSQVVGPMCIGLHVSLVPLDDDVGLRYYVSR
jgi:hypothetical protein